MSKVINTRILLSFATLIVAAAVVIGATFAFFSDAETSSNNTLTAGAIDLKIDNTSYYNGVFNNDTTWTSDDLPGHLFFNFHDLKPSDFGEDTISLLVQNDAWACMNIITTKDDDNTCTEPELLSDPNCTDPAPPGNSNAFDGELGGLINFAFWADDGDNVYEQDERIFTSGSALTVRNGFTWTLADSNSSIWPTPGPLPGNEIRYIGKAWCFGTLTPAAVPAGNNDPTENSGFTCDGSTLNNASQTDSLMGDVTFSAVQARNNPNFTCASTEPSITPTPAVACGENNLIYASSVVNSGQGLRKNGTAVTSDRDDPLDATGVPQHPLGLPSDSPVIADSFFSLGFPHTNNSNTPGSIELDMGENFYPNPSGDDLFVFEVTGGTYPDETVSVYAKLNLGDSWSLLGTVSRDDGVELSAGGLTSARYVRLVEASILAPFEATADGYDVDAVKAFCTDANND